MEKGIHTYEVKVDGTAFSAEEVEIALEYNDPLQENNKPILFAHYYNDNDEKVWIDEVDHITYSSENHNITIDIDPYINAESQENKLKLNDIIYVQLASDLHNKYRYYHDFDINLRSNDIILQDRIVTNNPEDNLIANYESAHFIYDVQEKEDWAKGKVKQILATLDDSNSLRYYLDEDLSDPDGWADYKTLIMKMGLLNPYVLDYLEVKFYFTNSSGLQLIGISEITLEMFDDDTGAVYIPLPESDDFDKFIIANNAYIEFTPIFYEAKDFEGYFYEKDLPTMQTIIWNADSVENGMLSVALEQDVFNSNEMVYVLNNLYEYIYAVNISTFTQEFSYYDNNDAYELEFYNVSLPMYYNDTNGNLIEIRNEEFLYLKYNATLEKSIGLTIEEMVLEKDNYLPNFEDAQPNVPVAEISLLGVNVNNDEFCYSTVDDLFLNRTELVAWNDDLLLTPFEDKFHDAYKQAVFNISFDDISADFITTDETGVQYSYITDILISSNDPSYELVIDSFFIFEFDYNSTLYDSEIFDLYPYNHMQEFYFSYDNIYDTIITLNCSEYLPLYYYDQNINETLYFEAYGSRDNYYYFGEHLFAQNISEGVYSITWNPWYSEKFYYEAKHAEDYEELMGYYEYYNPYISNYSYLYISWADQNSVYEWRTIEQYNVIPDSIEVVYEHYNETTEEFSTVYYNQTLDEFEVRQLATEYFYPYNISTNNYEFTLSQNYSQAINLDVLTCEAFYFDEFNLTLTAEAF